MKPLVGLLAELESWETFNPLNMTYLYSLANTAALWPLDALKLLVAPKWNSQHDLLITHIYYKIYAHNCKCNKHQSVLEYDSGEGRHLVC